MIKKQSQEISIKLLFDLKEVIKSNDKKEVEFDIEILSIEETTPFKVNEEFFKKIGLKNENELKENLKKN